MAEVEVLEVVMRAFRVGDKIIPENRIISFEVSGDEIEVTYENATNIGRESCKLADFEEGSMSAFLWRLQLNFAPFRDSPQSDLNRRWDGWEATSVPVKREPTDAVGVPLNSTVGKVSIPAGKVIGGE